MNIKKKNKKRILPLILAISLILSVIPSTIFAEDVGDNFYDENIATLENNTDDGENSDNVIFAELETGSENDIQSENETGNDDQIEADVNLENESQPTNEISDITALPPDITLRSSLDNYFVEGGGIDSSLYSTLTSALAAINGDSGSDYTISVLSNDDITSDGTASLNRAGVNVTLKTLSGAATATLTKSSGRHITINNGTLTLSNITLDGGSNSGGGVYVKGTLSSTTVSAKFVMENGATIQYCYNSSNGGGVLVYDEATFIMNGGKIVNNTAGAGAGVYLYNNSQFTMNGGTISGNIATGFGGGVNVNQSSSRISEFVMNGGSIVDNKARYGGGVYVTAAGIYYSKFTIDGSAVISNNNATEKGGGVYTMGIFTMKDGTICNNYAPDGGGAFVSMGAFDMQGGEITDNDAGKGAGVYGLSVNIYISGTASISKNTATDSGGGIYFSIGNIYMSGGMIGGENTGDANTAVNGGGVYFAGSSYLFDITGGSIANNVASSNGGGIYFYSGTVNMQGGSIVNNAAEGGEGGGVYATATNKTFTMSGDAAIVRNTSNGNGGGFYIGGTGNTLSLTGGTISENTAKGGDGGGVYAGGSSATLNISGNAAAIAGNVAENNGGGVYLESDTRLQMSDGEFADNFSTEDGGAIYAEVTDYSAYSILEIGSAARFYGNNAKAAYIPEAAHVQTNLNSGYITTNSNSISALGITSPLTNYDINYQSSDQATLKIVYNTNGGTGTDFEYSKLKPNSTQTIIAASVAGFQRSGYSFTGWNTASDASGTVYAVGHIFQISEDLMLYAQWSKDGVTVTSPTPAPTTPAVVSPTPTTPVKVDDETTDSETTSTATATTTTTATATTPPTATTPATATATPTPSETTPSPSTQTEGSTSSSTPSGGDEVSPTLAPSGEGDGLSEEIDSTMPSEYENGEVILLGSSNPQNLGFECNSQH